jgi:diaminopimelate epimerase
LKFTKIHGAGNDFILIDDRLQLCSLDPASIQKLCHRHFGIGADGLILLQNDPLADFRMRIFNSDGMEADGCGNGLRCLGKFLIELGFNAENKHIATGDRVVEIFYSGDLIGVDMGEPKGFRQDIQTEKGTIHFVDTGVRHIVHFTDSLENLEELGPYFRHHPLFTPSGVNVNLASIEKKSIRVRTFERGVEAETLACGTGACAVAYIANKVHGIKSPIPISFKGGDLKIEIEKNRLKMIGPAIKVYNGLLAINSYYMTNF